MRFDFAGMPQPLLHLITLFLASSQVTATPLIQNLQGLSLNSLFGRGTCAIPCGWSGQLCCAAGQACYTDANNQAQCSSTAAAAATTAYVANGGYWQMYTTTFVETDLVTVTKIASTYIASAAVATTAYVAATTAVSTCNYALNETPCGSICCASSQYCYASGQCVANANGASSGYASTITSSAAYSAPLRPTSSTLVVVTATNRPTTTVPFLSPVATGANITLTPTEAQASTGLSGGAIAGIVIGVLLGLALLFLICFYCCLKGIFDGLLAIFGLGKKRRTRETEYIEERHHHSSYGGAAGGGGRTWYGSNNRPARVERREEKKKGGNLLGIAAGLGGLAALLGLKRKRDDRRRQDEKSDYSSSYGSSYYTSESESHIQNATARDGLDTDYYTTGSASSDDRRTRDTRRSSRR